MKRSEINKSIDNANEVLRHHRISLPAWANLPPHEWKTKREEYSEIFENQLGWDVTDFAKGDFMREGLTLFTVRNGNPAFGGPMKTYCEKIMIVYPGQITPTHFHWKKMEDIINRGGGIFGIQLWKANEREEKTEEPFSVSIDGVRRKVKGGDIIYLDPGESICFEPYVYHTFWAENETCVVGEVSTVNDDANDNRFYEQLGRYPLIQEDENARYCLCNEYR